MTELARSWNYHTMLLNNMRECFHGLNYQDSCPRCTSRVRRMRCVAEMEQIDAEYSARAS